MRGRLERAGPDVTVKRRIEAARPAATPTPTATLVKIGSADPPVRETGEP